MFVEANNNSFINNFTLDLYWCILGYSTPFTFDWCVSIFKGCTIGYSTHTFYLRLLPYIVYSILHFRALGTQHRHYLTNISKSFATNKHVNLKDGKKYIDTKWYVRRQSEKTGEG